ncbi:putative F-box protein PP2-B12 [Cynara cardunculus var. scolymus]|uniref:putative F-box protein PP2-B12 n=1 Tax=Cynara cardunculus var. scolymus TaxID=59895 RepID=UPI000D626027|nr:putative F-box protein PP2-B12 [Cynara cardunculus var. scolymus]
MGGGLLKMGTDGGDEGEIDGGVQGNFFGSLPEGFVANALSLTSPRDVCRLSLVCSVFRSAAEWDAVWEKFLPPNYQNILAEAGEGGDGGLVRSGSKKALYLRLCDHPVIIDGGNKSFFLDKWSGKKCYMLAARDLSIVWGDTPRYWRWISVPNSRFREVAELISVCWLEVHGRISTAMLSANTCYVAYLVYKSALGAYGFEYQPAEVSVGISGAENETKTVFLDQEAWQRQSYERGLPGRRMGMFNRVRRLGSLPAAATMVNGPKRRQDGWLEIELGEYWNQKGEEGEVEMSMTEVKGGNWKGGLIIQGIEIRIRHDR